jgi:hypothetical protein
MRRTWQLCVAQNLSDNAWRILLMPGQAHRSKEEKRCQRPNWSKQTQTGDRAGSSVQIQNHCGWSNNRLLFGRLRRWVGGWVQGAAVGKSLLWFLVDIHLSWFCQPPTLSNVEQQHAQKKLDSIQFGWAIWQNVMLWRVNAFDDYIN